MTATFWQCINFYIGKVRDGDKVGWDGVSFTDIVTVRYFIANFDFLLYMIYDFSVNLFSLIVLLPWECIFKMYSKISYLDVLLFSLQWVLVLDSQYKQKWNPFIDFICQLWCSISYILECNILIRFPPLKVECFKKMPIWFASRYKLWIFLTQVTWSV